MLPFVAGAAIYQTSGISLYTFLTNILLPPVLSSSIVVPSLICLEDYFSNGNTTRALPGKDSISIKSSNVNDAQKRTSETHSNLVQTSEAKITLMADTKQNAKKTEEVVTEVQNIAVVEKGTFESLLKKITEEKSEKLDSVLSALEQIKDTLTFSQVETIQSVIEMAKENKAYREAGAKKDRVIAMYIKINSILEERLMEFEGAVKETNSSNITFRKG